MSSKQITPTSWSEVAQASILPTFSVLGGGKLTSGNNPVSCLSLSELLAKSLLSIRSEISTQL